MELSICIPTSAVFLEFLLLEYRRYSAKWLRTRKTVEFSPWISTFLLLAFSSFIDEAAREKLSSFSSLSGDESYQSHDLEKVIQQVAKHLYDAKVQPTTLLPKQAGNMYTASLYAAFATLLHKKHDSLVSILL